MAFTKNIALFLLQLIPDSRVMNHLINQLNHFRLHGRFMVRGRLSDINDYIFSIKNSPYSASYGFFIDKETVKSFVASVFGERYIIPTLGVFRDVAALSSFDYPTAYVVKPTHMSQKVLFKDGGRLTPQELQQCGKWLKYSYFARTRQYNYRFLEPKIIIEPFVGENGKVPPDFKFFVVNGKCQLIQVDYGRFADRSSDFYDPDWNKLDIQMGFGNSPYYLNVGDALEHMKELAEKIGACFEFIRVDLYLTEQGIKFGEYTFTPGLRFEPAELGKAMYTKILAAKQKHEQLWCAS